MKTRGIAIAFNTNGLTLDDDLAKFMVEIELDSISFSIDAASRESLLKVRGVDKLEKIEAAVFRMLAARGARELPGISVSFTLQEANRHKEQEFVERWSGIVDCVRVQLLFEKGTFPDMKPPEQRLPCPALYKTMPVHNDGTVIICCLDGFKNTNVGNVFEDGVKAVWNGEEFSKVRYYHDQPMGQSSVLQELQRHVIPNGLTGQVSRSRTAERVVAFYNKRGTYDQWIKEGKGAIKWTRLSCRMFAANAVRLQLHALARHKSES